MRQVLGTLLTTESRLLAPCWEQVMVTDWQDVDNLMSWSTGGPESIVCILSTVLTEARTKQSSVLLLLNLQNVRFCYKQKFALNRLCTLHFHFIAM